MKRILAYLISISIGFGIIYSLMYINPYEGNITLSDAVLQLSGSRGMFSLGFSLDALVTLSMKLIPIYMLEVYMGILIYRNFCTAAVYIFSRQTNRIRWFVNEICRMSAAVFLVYGIYTVTAVLIAGIRYELIVDQKGMYVFLFHIAIESIGIIGFSLILNYCAIFLGSSTAYSITIGIQLVFIVMLYSADILVRKTNGRIPYKALLQYNPMAHMILGWHKDVYNSVSQQVENAFLGVTLVNSLLFFIFASISLAVLGAIIINKHEFYANNLEKEVN